MYPFFTLKTMDKELIPQFLTTNTYIPKEPKLMMAGATQLYLYFEPGTITLISYYHVKVYDLNLTELTDIKLEEPIEQIKVNKNENNLFLQNKYYEISIFQKLPNTVDYSLIITLDSGFAYGLDFLPFRNDSIILIKKDKENSEIILNEFIKSNSKRMHVDNIIYAETDENVLVIYNGTQLQKYAEVSENTKPIVTNVKTTDLLKCLVIYDKYSIYGFNDSKNSIHEVNIFDILTLEKQQVIKMTENIKEIQLYNNSFSVENDKNCYYFYQKSEKKNKEIYWPETSFYTIKFKSQLRLIGYYRSIPSVVETFCAVNSSIIRFVVVESLSYGMEIIREFYLF